MIVEALRRRLRLVLGGRGAGVRPDPAATGPASTRLGAETQDVLALAPEVEFVAYAEDCRIFGHVRLTADRLTDLLNEHEEVLLVDVLVERLADGAIFEAKEVLVPREEILAVHASGPRGAPGRRTRARPFPIAVRVGPYTIRGHFHALPGTDPIASFRRRKPMVPLTEAWIEYQRGGELRQGRTGTLIVNRHLCEWVQLVDDEEIALPELPVETKPGLFAKDLTGHVLTFRDV